jgi:8-oxo-dGTP diphosphatase
VVLALFEPKRLSAATPLRCKQTLQPLGDKLGLPVVIDSAFAEPGDPAEVPAKVQIAIARLAELRAGDTAVICSQGKLIPPLLAALEGAGDPARYKTPKGGGWLLTWSGDRLLALSRL